MCGITGIMAFNELGRMFMPNIQLATTALEKRGPDSLGYFVDERVALGHRRLSIQDPSLLGKQPMSTESKRYTLVFNGEVYNFKALRGQLEKDGVSFKSGTDTEVVLSLYEKEGFSAFQKLNGFFALAIFDKEEGELVLARDRYGIKPLIYYIDEDRFVFGSEMKSLIAFKIPKELDYSSLRHYFQLSYIPQPFTCFKNTHKLKPGHYAVVKGKKIVEQAYYDIKVNHQEQHALSYANQQKKLRELLTESVHDRLVSDVPLGAFLSGGIDSSIICAIASKEVQDLKTFSIGYSDEPYFDETTYAELVAKKLKTDHQSFKLSNDHLFDQLDHVLEYIDEPYGDSSSLPVYILSQLTRKEVTVALSGDGADEVFSGYNKHLGEYKARSGGLLASMVGATGFLWDVLPKSRNFPMSNKVRQLQRFAKGLNLSPEDRYWLWCKYIDEEQAERLFHKDIRQQFESGYEGRKEYLLRHIQGKSFNEVLRTDVELVLQSDMLTKVDMMSMANSLEIRVPFLDHRVVDFAFGLPVSSKLKGGIKKRILQDTFREDLPSELYNRPKHGFEVPLLKWFRTDLRRKIERDLLADDFIEAQQIFEVESIRKLKKKLFSNNPEEVHAQMWMMIVFQSWWKRYFE